MRWRDQSPWIRHEPPHAPPREPCALVSVEDALITPFARGRLHAVVGPRRWMSGAVHGADGRLVETSQRMWAGDAVAPVAADPEFVRVPANPRRLEGSWIYAGHWTNHFGHFFVETLTNLWPELAATGLSGIVAHRSYRGGVGKPGQGAGMVQPHLTGWHEGLLELAGYGRLDVRVVRSRPLAIERLLVPERPVVLKSWVRPEGVQLWRRAARAVTPGADGKVFLSRTLFHQSNSGDGQRVRVAPHHDRELDRTFAEAGFRVVHPETLPLRDQIATVRGASVLAGSQGSALHLAAFADPGARILEVGDTRSPTASMPTQQIIDAACEHRSAFVPHGDRSALARVLAAVDR